MFSKFTKRMKHNVERKVHESKVKANKAARVSLVIFDCVLCGNYNFEDIKKTIEARINLIEFNKLEKDLSDNRKRYVGCLGGAEATKHIDKKLSKNKKETEPLLKEPLPENSHPKKNKKNKKSKGKKKSK